MKREASSLYISDDRGITEPYSDIISMMLVVVGFTMFFVVVVQTYNAYADRAFIIGHSQDALRLAEALRADPLFISGDGTDIIDANKVRETAERPGNLYSRYGSLYNFIVKIEAKSDSITCCEIIKKPGTETPKLGIAFSIPVTVKLNDAELVQGTLSVKIWRK